ncbi:MAG TPA: family 10 glycosylhydrolase, partial [Bacteroidales bacterium]|nr:family 10 glycosylhydrolase [Bacteroidales bacterium]
MNRLCYFAILVIVNGFVSQNTLARQIPQEMRGVWVSTVFNIDWPSRAGLDAAAQQAEAIAILDQAKSLGLNTVFLQVRPSGDAIYPSALVPWSRFLSGRQGQPTQPSYDPLQFWIEQAHRRGLELHAWINPFRATTGLNDHLDPMHAMLRRPDWVVQYGNRNYLDPGLPEVRQHLLEVIAELITRYDIDGLHIDDYFYPYPVWGTEFPDTLSFRRFGNGNPATRNDWRRENINTVIRSIHNLVQQQKPWIKFGVSPFGVWRNRSTDPA